MLKKMYIVLIIGYILLFATSCGKYDYNGNWYSAEDGNLYVFSNGMIVCEDDYIMLSNGQKGTGYFYNNGDYLEMYVMHFIGTADEPQNVYLAEDETGDLLCLDKAGNEVVFCKKSATAQQIVNERNADELRKKQEAEEKRLLAEKSRCKLQ